MKTFKFSINNFFLVFQPFLGSKTQHWCISNSELNWLCIFWRNITSQHYSNLITRQFTKLQEINLSKINSEAY